MNMFARTVSARIGGATMCARGYATSGLPRMAVLDDYLCVAKPHFDKVPPQKLDVEVFESYLPQRTEQERAALVEKLKPFSVISTMRERTQFPASVLKELPYLKLLLCSKWSWLTLKALADRW